MRLRNPFRSCQLGSSTRGRAARFSEYRFSFSAIETLEERDLLVIGAFDILELDLGASYDGVARINRGTGALLSTGRHVLTAAHVSFPNGPSPTRFWVDSPMGVVQINTPAEDFTAPNGYPPGNADFDIGVMTLAELAPLNAQGWDIYTDTDEVGQVGRLVGWGGTGTGTIGHSTDIDTDKFWTTAIGTNADTNYEVVRFTITGDPTGGSFFPRLSNEAPPVQPAVPFNTDANTLRMALNSLPGISNVIVRLVGDSDFDGVVDDDTVNPYAGSFEVLFRGTQSAEHDLPGSVIATHNFTGGSNPNIQLDRLLEGGTERKLTNGFNRVSLESGNGARFFTDFDDGTANADTFDDTLGAGTAEAHGTWGDSGSPLFLDGKIAGVLEGLQGSAGGFSSGGGFDGNGGSGDFGEIDSWARVSFHQDFINNILDDPFDLVLNMENQPWGGDGDSDTIEVSRVFNTLQIRIDDVLYYSESINLIESVTVRGSFDDETFIISALGDGIPVEVVGGDGDDVIRLEGLSDAPAILFGSGGADMITVGDGDFASSINGPVLVSAGSNPSETLDTLVLDDQLGSGNDTYRLVDDTFTMSTYPNEVRYLGVEKVHLQANEDDNTIRIPSTSLFTTLSVSANSGNDVFRFGGGNVASNISGDVQLHGGFGDDLLVLLDQDNTTVGDTHTLGPSTYEKTSYAGTLTFNFVQEVRLRTGAVDETVEVLGTSEDVDRLLINTGNGADTVKLRGTQPNTLAEIRTSRGNDRVELTPSGGDLDALGTHVVVDGGLGKGDELLFFDHFDAGNDTYGIHATTVVKTGLQVDYSRVELLTLNANPFANQIVVESTSAATEVAVNADSGPDMIHIAPASRRLASVLGPVFVDGEDGADVVLVHDEENPAVAAGLTIQDNLVSRAGFELHYEDVDELIVLLGAAVDSVDIPSTAPGMHVHVNTASGGDSISANVPTGSRLTLDGNLGADSVELTGTPADDAVSVSAGYGMADVNLISFKDARIDLADGADELRFVGIAGVDEDVEVHASTTAAAGRLRAVGLLDLAFENTEFIDLVANPADNDNAAFIATDQDDEFAIHLAADGTDFAPVLELLDPQTLALLLTLRDYANFGTLGILGGSGVDQFNVHVAPAGPGTGRNLLIDGGPPAGGGDGKDELNVFFETPPRPDIDHDHDNNNDLGTFDIEYDLEEFFIEYLNIEKAASKSAAAG